MLWQLLAYGRTGGQISPRQLEVTRLYPKWALIAAAIVWTVLITFVCVAVGLKFPDG